MKKQSHVIDGFPEVFGGEAAYHALTRLSRFSHRSHREKRAIHPLSPAREGIRNQRVRFSNSQKQSRFMPDFQRFSSSASSPDQFLVGVVRERPATTAQSRRSSALATTLRAVREPPLRRNLELRDLRAHRNEKTNPLYARFPRLSAPVPLPLQGKGLGVRSAWPSREDALPLSPVCHASRIVAVATSAPSTLSRQRERGHPEAASFADSTKRSQIFRYPACSPLSYPPSLQNCPPFISSLSILWRGCGVLAGVRQGRGWRLGPQAYEVI